MLCLPILPAWKNPCSAPIRENPCSVSNIFTCSCGSSWTSTTFSWFHVPVDLCRQIYSLAGNFSFCRYFGKGVCLVPWMDSRFRVSAIITSDRGAQFTSSLWSAICSLLGIIPNKTTAFHPQANGLVERFHRQLKNSLRACLAASDWCSHLPWVLLGLCTAPREDSASSSAEAAYGSDLILPHQFLQSQDPPSNQFYEKLKNSMSGFRPVPACNNTPVMDVLLEEFHRILLLWSQLILKGDPASAFDCYNSKEE